MTLESFRKEHLTDTQASIFVKFLNLIEKLYIPLFVILIGITAFLCFYHLDVGYVNSFDEARHGINAYEMMQEKNFLVNTYGYENDYWNLKPPVSYWCIMLGYKIFGYNVFGLRFYSAFAYLLTVIVAGLFVKRYGKLESLTATAFLAANALSYTAHMTRTGDADALYVMFFSFAILAMLCIKNNHKFLYICGLMFALAFLTKSWHSGMIVVIGGLFLLFTGIIKEIKPKEWILFILSFALPIALWAIFRFTQDGTDFFTEMVAQDLLNRTGNAIEGHDYPTNFYFDYIFRGNYIYFPILIICFAGCIFFDKYFSKTSKSFDNMLAFGLWFFVPFVAFSLVKTKLIWYAYPSIIPISIVAGIFIARFMKSDRLLYKTRWVITIVTVIITIHYLHNCYSIIANQYSADYQNFIVEGSSRYNEYTGANAYTYSLGEDGSSIEYWTQDNMLLAELSGDYKCMDTGLDGFLKDSSTNPVLFIRTDYYNALSSNNVLDNCKIVYQATYGDVGYSIITK